MGDRRYEQDAGAETRFLVDRMLGALARDLRMFGFDAEYARQGSPESLIRQAARQSRCFVTRRPPRKTVNASGQVIKITHEHPHDQVVQVLCSLDAPPEPSRWFSRCLRCNRLLDDLSRQEVAGLVPEYVAQIHRSFRRCPSCGRVFWQGTHSRRMRQTMEEWLRRAEEAREERFD